MQQKPKISLKEIFYAVVVIAVTASILSPVIATTRGSSAVSNCQANLKRLGNSLKMYLADWNQTYPTNRNSSKMLLPSCQLSQVGLSPSSGEPYKFQYGITWVEGLYDYTDPIVSNSNPSSVWKCPAALFAQAGQNANERVSAEVTYVFNFNLLERSHSIIKDASRLMIVRETDRLVASNCCAFPVGFTSGATAPVIDSSSVIQASFHIKPDACIKAGSSAPVSNPTVNIHGEGSNILFADGHVKLFDAQAYFKTSEGITSTTANWDSATSAFYNYVNSDPAYGATDKAIQITP